MSTDTMFNMGGGINYNIDTKSGMTAAVAWQQALFETIADGGRWIVPRSMSVYEINHTKKTVRRIQGAFPEKIIQRVIEAAGWTYEERTVL